MRLREVQRILHEAIPQLNPEVASRGNKVLALENAGDLVETLHELNTVPGLNSRLVPLLTHTLLQRGHDRAVLVQPHEHPALEEVKVKLKELAADLSIFQAIVNTSLPKQNPNSITVVLPEGSLKEMIDRLSALEEQLHQLGGSQPTSVRVQNLDNGSLVVEIVGTLAVATTIAKPKHAARAAEAAFATVTFFIFSLATKAQAWRAADEAIIARSKALGILANEAEANQKLADDLRSRIRAELQKTETWEPEEVERLVNVTMKVSDQVHAGVRVFPAVMASDEVKQVTSENPVLPVLKTVVKGILTAGAGVDAPSGDVD